MASPVEPSLDFTVTNIEFIVHRPPNPSWKIEGLANHTSYILALSTDGEADYSFNGSTYHVNKGDILFFPKGMEHTAYSHSSNPWSYFSTAFDTYFLDLESTEAFNSLPNIFTTTLLSEYESLFGSLHRAWSGKKAGYLLKCRSLLLEILYLYLREALTANRDIPHMAVMEKIINFMLDNPARSFSIEELAAMAGMSSSHFRLIFKKVTGISAIQYQNRIKINRARDLLLSGACNVGEAAVSVGYADIYYFSRLFKKVTGVAPSSCVRRQL